MQRSCSVWWASPCYCLAVRAEGHLATGQSVTGRGRVGISGSARGPRTDATSTVGSFQRGDVACEVVKASRQSVIFGLLGEVAFEVQIPVAPSGRRGRGRWARLPSRGGSSCEQRDEFPKGDTLEVCVESCYKGLDVDGAMLV